MDHLRPKVATAVLVFKENKILLGRRRGDKKSGGMFGTPGGHVEHLERLVESAIREIAEETAVEVENVEMIGLVNVREFAPAHHVVVVMTAEWRAGNPVNCEPDRCEGWEWFGLDALPEPLTPATKKGIEVYTSDQLLVE